MKDIRVFESNLFAMILLILYAIFPAIIMMIFKGLNLPIYFRIILPQVILLFIPTVIYFIVKKRPVKETLRLKKIGLSTIIIIIIIGFVAQPVANFLSFITQFVFPNRIGKVVDSLSKIPLLVRLGAIALTPAIFEEITMRGVVLAGYDNVNIKKTAIMTGMFFAILHMDGNQSLYTFALGFLFAYLVRITGSIYSSMVCHFTINGSQVILSDLVLKYGSKTMNASTNTSLYSLPKKEIITTFLVLLILALICLKIIIRLIRKLIKIHGYEGIKDVESKENPVKVMNFPVYVSLIIYTIIIIGDILTRS